MGVQHTDLTLTAAQAEAMLAAWLGPGVACTGLERLQGGMLNAVWRVAFDRAPFDAVLKLRSPGDDVLSVEARDLACLRAAGFPCPQPYHEDSSRRHLDFAYLLLERVPGMDLGRVPLSPDDRARIDRELAEALLRLHAQRRDTFGDLGEAPRERQWARIFVPRLAAMRAEMEGRLPGEALPDVDRALAAADGVLSDQGEPTLVHGDIWARNVMVSWREGGWHLAGVLDPGAQYADVEFELAYLQAFGTPRDALFDVYTAQSPLRPGYEFRRLYYWLNTYMTHVWYFGDAYYREMAARVATAIARQV